MSRIIIPTYPGGFARNASESRTPGLWRGLKGAWLPFLGPSGRIIHDWSGHGNPGAFSRMDEDVGWILDEGIYCLDFTPLDRIYIPANNADALNLGEWGGSILTGSIAVWYNCDGYGAYSCIASRGPFSAWGEAYIIYLHSSGRPRMFLSSVSPNSSEYAQSAIIPAVNKWHLAVGTWDGSLIKIYVDGILQGQETQTVNCTPDANVLPFWLGNEGGDVNAFNGKIRQALLWDRAITANEIADINAESFVMWEVFRRAVVLKPGVAHQLTATAAAVITTAATLTKAGIVEMTATAAASTTTSADLGVTFAMTATCAASAATSAGLGVTFPMTATCAAVTSAEATLTLDDKEYFLYVPLPTISEEGTIWVIKSQTNAVPNIDTLTIDNSTTAIQIEINAIPNIYTLTAEADALKARTKPNKVLLYTGTYTDYTAEAKDITLDDVVLSAGVGSILYIGYKEKFYAVKITVSTAGVGTYTLLAPKYYDGAAWQTFPCSTEELDDFKTAEVIHAGGLPDDPDDWALLSIEGSLLYWMAIETSAGTQSQQPLGQRISLQIVGESYRFVTFASDEVYQEFF